MRKINNNKFKKKIIIPIVIILIITFSILLYINYQKNKDIFKDTNLLLGTWKYNEYGGTYIFKEDYTYIQYSNSDKTNNYCKGTYKYSYGATSKESLKLRQDENYYYYDLILKEDECLIMNKLTKDEYTKKMYFAINKDDNLNEILFANIETENIFTLTKIN